MTTTIDRTDGLVRRLFGATLGALEPFSGYLGAEPEAVPGRREALGHPLVGPRARRPDL